MGLKQSFYVFLVSHKFSKFIQSNWSLDFVFLGKERGPNELMTLSGLVLSVQEKVAVLLCVLDELSVFRRLLSLGALRILNVLEWVLFSETLVKFILDDETTLILKLIVVNFSQTVNVVKTLHEIIKTINLEGLELVAKESVEHLGELLVNVKIDQSGKKNEGNVTDEGLIGVV